MVARKHGHLEIFDGADRADVLLRANAYMKEKGAFIFHSLITSVDNKPYYCIVIATDEYD